MTSTGIATIGDVERLEAVPLTERDLPGSVLEVIERGRDACEGRDALIFLPDAARPGEVRRYSYDALIREVERTAAGLFALTPQDDNVYAIVLPNLPEMHFSLWGAQTVGRACPINPLLEPSAIANILRAAGASLVVTLAPLAGQDLFQKVVEAALQAPTVTTLVLVDPVPHLGQTTEMMASAARLAPALQIASFAALAASPDAPSVPRRGGGHVGALFHTGGTTGSPKIAQLTHDNQIFTAWAANANRTMERNRTIFCGLPLFHVNGALVTGLVTWMTGATVLLGPAQGFRAPGLLDNFWHIVEHHRVGAMSAVPTVYAMLTEVPVGGRDITSLEFCICGAAAMRVETIRRFEAMTGAPLLEGYGLTEGACVSTINPGRGERRPGSVGLRAPYQRLVILDQSDPMHQPAIESGISGIVALKGPNVFAGYLNTRDDAKAWITVEGERWYDTGDLGRIDDDGYLWLTGRKKDLIIRGGHNIDPSVIEEALSLHPDIKLAAAVGSPDLRLGEVPVAYVELNQGAASDEAMLEAFARRNIAERAAIPRQIFILPAMPLTAIGKIYKPELRRLEVERVVNQRLRDRFGDGLTASVLLDPQAGLIGRLNTVGRTIGPDDRALAKGMLPTTG